jgi:hypothetical protein
MTIYGSTCYTVVVKHVRMCSRTVTFCKMQVLVTIQTSAIRFRLVFYLDQFSITFYEKVLKIAIFRQAVLSPLYAILGVTS